MGGGSGFVGKEGVLHRVGVVITQGPGALYALERVELTAAVALPLNIHSLEYTKKTVDEILGTRTFDFDTQLPASSRLKAIRHVAVLEMLA